MQPTSRRDESIRINYDNIDRSELPNSSSKVHHDVHLKESNYFWWKIWPATLSHIQIFIRYAMYAIYLNILINLIRFVIESSKMATEFSSSLNYGRVHVQKGSAMKWEESSNIGLGDFRARLPPLAAEWSNQVRGNPRTAILSFVLSFFGRREKEDVPKSRMNGRHKRLTNGLGMKEKKTRHLPVPVDSIFF